MSLDGSGLLFRTTPQNLRTIRAEGDSYSTIGTGIGTGYPMLLQTVQSLGGTRGLLSTAVGGSSIDQIEARIAANPNLAHITTTILWDGSAADYISVASYLGFVDQILAVTGIANIVYLPPVPRGPSVSSTPTQATLDMEAIAAGLVSREVPTFSPVPIVNTLNNGSAQDLQDIQARVICTSCLADGVHLTVPAYQLVGVNVANKMIANSI